MICVNIFTHQFKQPSYNSLHHCQICCDKIPRTERKYLQSLNSFTHKSVAAFPFTAIYYRKYFFQFPTENSFDIFSLNQRILLATAVADENHRDGYCFAGDELLSREIERILGTSKTFRNTRYMSSSKVSNLISCSNLYFDSGIQKMCG